MFFVLLLLLLLLLLLFCLFLCFFFNLHRLNLEPQDLSLDWTVGQMWVTSPQLIVVSSSDPPPRPATAGGGGMFGGKSGASMESAIQAAIDAAVATALKSYGLTSRAGPQVTAAQKKEWERQLGELTAKKAAAVAGEDYAAAAKLKEEIDEVRVWVIRFMRHTCGNRCE